MAEGLLRHHLKQTEWGNTVQVRSAGTQATQPGSRPDQRAQRAAALAGVHIGRIRARRVTERDLVRSDLILAMDGTNVRDLMEMCPAGHEHKISLLLGHSLGHELDEVPDPYYGSAEGFEQVFELIDLAVANLILQLPDQIR
jgi:protein-tyrosine phosphatase